jgi:membrane protein DedA with SNARE-associated domain
MEEILDLAGPLAQWVQHWGYLAVFLGIMLENAGVPVPGETIIVLGSIMAGRGVLRVEVLYLVCVVGAILGDNIGYLVGLRGGRPLLFRIGKVWNISEEKILETEANFRKHADWGVFIGRYIMILRIFAGPLAGMIGMPWARFFVFNALGAITWCGLIVGAAYLLGVHVTKLLHNIGLTFLGAFLLAVAYFAFRHWRAKRQRQPSHPSLPPREE